MANQENRALQSVLAWRKTTIGPCIAAAPGLGLHPEILLDLLPPRKSICPARVSDKPGNPATLRSIGGTNGVSRLAAVPNFIVP